MRQCNTANQLGIKNEKTTKQGRTRTNKEREREREREREKEKERKGIAKVVDSTSANTCTMPAWSRSTARKINAASFASAQFKRPMRTSEADTRTHARTHTRTYMQM